MKDRTQATYKQLMLKRPPKKWKWEKCEHKLNWKTNIMFGSTFVKLILNIIEFVGIDLIKIDFEIK